MSGKRQKRKFASNKNETTEARVTVESHPLSIPEKEKNKDETSKRNVKKRKIDSSHNKTEQIQTSESEVQTVQSSASNITLLQLPQDILITIFSFLPLYNLVVVAQVCSMFNTIINKGPNPLWKKISLRNIRKISGSAITVLLQRAGRFLKSLTLRFRADPGDLQHYHNVRNAGVISALLQLPTLCPHVESVKLQMLSFTPQQYHSFISSLTNLKRFQFRECSKYMNPENGVSELLNPLTSYCTKLIDFDMSFDFFHCNKQNIDAIEEFGKVIGTQLQRLNLSFSYTRWDGNLIAYLLPYCTNLIELDVGYCMDFTDVEGRAILNMTKLRSLNLDGNRLSDSGMELIVRACTKLESLKLQRSIQLTDKAVVAIAKNCTNLTKLDLSGCWRIDAPECFFTVASLCTKLQTLRLGSNNSVTWEVCRQLLLRLPLLENFDISDIGQSLNISELCQLGTKLKKLKISGYGISHENALQLTSLTGLQHLSVDEMDGLNLLTMEEFIRKLTGLQSLSIPNHYIDQDEIFHGLKQVIAESTPHLQLRGSDDDFNDDNHESSDDESDLLRKRDTDPRDDNDEESFEEEDDDDDDISYATEYDSDEDEDWVDTE